MAKIPTRPLTRKQWVEWCQQKIDDPDTSEKDRTLWRQLRDEQADGQTEEAVDPEQGSLW